MFYIEDGTFPLTKAYHMKKSEIRLTMESLKVGQSFFVSDFNFRKVSQSMRFCRYVSNIATKLRNEVDPGMFFITRTVPGGYRCWRASPKRAWKANS